MVGLSGLAEFGFHLRRTKSPAKRLLLLVMLREYKVLGSSGLSLSIQRLRFSHMKGFS